MFIEGLNEIWKALLRYVFPIYIAGLFVIDLRHYSKLSNICGDRSVPNLATLLFLSYSKLVHVIIASLQLAVITTYLSVIKAWVGTLALLICITEIT